MDVSTVSSGDAREAQVAAALARCAAGDRSALRVIYEIEAARMVAVARRILHRVDLAEEAVHDAFLRVWRAANSFDPARGSARGWIYAIVRNRALTIRRDEGRLEFDGDAPDVPMADSDGEVGLLPDTSALRRCLEQLEPRRRSAVVLAYVHGLSHGELAGRLGVPLGTAKSWVKRSLASLQECMG
jgi:RNA polymerase sigma-70 factor (ECF subfamily)